MPGRHDPNGDGHRLHLPLDGARVQRGVGAAEHVLGPEDVAAVAVLEELGCV